MPVSSAPSPGIKHARKLITHGQVGDHDATLSHVDDGEETDDEHQVICSTTGKKRRLHLLGDLLHAFTLHKAGDDAKLHTDDDGKVVVVDGSRRIIRFFGFFLLFCEERKQDDPRILKEL